MAALTNYLWVAAGVAVAVALPILSANIRKEFPLVSGDTIPPWIRRYLLLLVFSLATAIVVWAIWRTSNPASELPWYTAFLFGFTWELALEKFFHPKP